MKFAVALLAFFFLPIVPALAERVADLPSPLPHSYVSDNAGLLAADTKVELDRLATTIDDAGRGQLAFVTVRNTGGVDPRQFASELMTRWGVGHAAQDDGVLILIARDDRAAEIVLGDGIDSPENVAHADRVMQNEMVPRFRDGNYDQALVAGGNALLQSVYATDLSQPSEAPTAPGVQPLAGLDANAPLAATTAPPVIRATPSAAAEPAKDVPVGPLAIGLGILAGIVGAVGWVAWKIFSGLWWLVGSRFMPRRCGACSAQMNLLDEAADDAHLNPAELTEERLKSVNHRIFLCPACNQVEKLSRRAWFSSYANCKQCASRAVSRVSRTIQAATRSSTGLAEVTESCQNCNHTATSRQVLPCLPPPSSSSSSGRSYGGGSNSGRGASGRW